MMQEPKAPPAPIGVVYNTSMTRPDAALAIAALYVASSRRDARVNGICVNGAGLDAAIFCDIVARFYTSTARAPSSNIAPPVGFDASSPPASSSAMVEAVVKKTKTDGQPQYVRSIQRVTDTAAPDALLRNAITFSAEAVVVLSAPATWLARSLALAGSREQYRQRVKRIVIVEGGDLDSDAAAAKALIASLPFPAVSVGPEVAQALSVPVSRIQGAFTWAPANPVADAVTASGLPEVRLQDVAAVHYALHPDSGLFEVTGGRLQLEASKRDACADALVAFATAKPAAPPARGGRGAGLPDGLAKNFAPVLFS
ncbi:MAG TPA: hypothetical protein VFZ98_02975 [Vicinamibacterales bacterium]